MNRFEWMRFRASFSTRCCFALVALLVLGMSKSQAYGQKLVRPAEIKKRDLSHVPTGHRTCIYPKGTVRKPEASGGILRLQSASEVEPNDTLSDAQVLPLGTGPGEDPDVDIVGDVATIPDDIDVFRFTAKKGDIIGAACLGQGLMDPLLAIYDDNIKLMIGNDDDNGVSFFTPPGSPFPVAALPTDSGFTWVVPTTGTYYIVVFPSVATTVGPYKLSIRTRRSRYESAVAAPAKQIIFLDFDGATFVPQSVWPESFNDALTTFSPLSTFIPRWGLTPADESAVIDAIIQHVKENFDDLRRAELNGNFPVDSIAGHFDFEIRNSRDDADPFGQPNVARVIIGGTIAQLGVDTIGLAQYIDPGNYATEDTAIVLLDLLSEAPTDLNSINGLFRAENFGIIPLIGRVVGNITSHELGHLLGCYHTDLYNDQPSIMDAGGSLDNDAELGPDFTAGTLDDIDDDFVADDYDWFEAIGYGKEPTHVRVAFALSTGANVPDTAAPDVFSKLPAADASLSTLSVIRLVITEPIFGVTASALSVNGSPATNLTGTSSGPYEFSGFAQPVVGTAAVVLSGANIKDAAGNALHDMTWAYDIIPVPNEGGTGGENGNGDNGGNDGGNDNSGTGDSTLALNLGGDVAVGIGQTVKLGGSPPVSGGAAPYAYSWTLRGNAGSKTSVEPNPTFGPAPEGTYVARLIATDSLGAAKTGFIKIVVGNGGGTIGLLTGSVGSESTGALCGVSTLMPLLAVCCGCVLMRRARRRQRSK